MPDALAEAKKFKRYYIYYPYYWIKNRIQVMFYKSKEFYLLDYKGKFTIISDEVGVMDIEVGMISKERAIREAPERKASAEHYGVPAYIGDDEDLLKDYL